MRAYLMFFLLFLIILTSGCVSGNANFSDFLGTMQTVLVELAQIICDLVDVVQMVAGLLATLIIVMTGLKWIISQDNPQERFKAQETLKAVVIGLVVVLIATYLVEIVLGQTCA